MDYTGKWIGFDMDECLGEFVTLSVFPQIQTWLESFRSSGCNTDEFNRQFTARIVARLAAAEKEGKTALLRPGLIEALQHIKTSNIFILSNNGCDLLIQWVAALINQLLEKQLFKSTQVFGLSHPFRIEYGVKNMMAVMLCTGCIPQELLFFDDCDHELAGEFGVTYVKVAPYTYKTPIMPIAQVFIDVLEESTDILNVEAAREKMHFLQNVSTLTDLANANFPGLCFEPLAHQPENQSQEIERQIVDWIAAGSL